MVAGLNLPFAALSGHTDQGEEKRVKAEWRLLHGYRS
jgi:hypothetical protein